MIFEKIMFHFDLRNIVKICLLWFIKCDSGSSLKVCYFKSQQSSKVLCTISLHCVKSVRIRSFFWSVFFLIRTVFSIQSKCGKMRTRKNSVIGHIPQSVSDSRPRVFLWIFPLWCLWLPGKHYTEMILISDERQSYILGHVKYHHGQDKAL